MLNRGSGFFCGYFFHAGGWCVYQLQGFSKYVDDIETVPETHNALGHPAH